MSYGGIDGHLEKGRVCFVRPARKRRPYSLQDLARVFRYVAAEHGIDHAYCRIVSGVGAGEQIDDVIDTLRDIPCVDTDVLSVIPDAVRDAIRDAIGSDVDLITPCEDLDVADRLKRYAAIVLAIVALFVRVKNMRVVRWILRRVVLFGVLIALIERLEELAEALLKLSNFVSDAIPLLQALSCAKSEDGTIIAPITSVVDIDLDSIIGERDGTG